MTIDTLQTTVSSDAPALAVLLDGPLAQTALSALGKALLDDDQASVDQIEAAIAQAGTRPVAAFKQAEAGALAQIAAAGGDADAAAAEASESARKLGTMIELERQRNESVKAAYARQEHARDWWLNPLLAVLVTGGFFATIAFLLTHSPPPEVSAVAQTMLGVLGTAWVSIITFYFGSSAGSKFKTDLLATQLDPPAEPPAPRV